MRRREDGISSRAIMAALRHSSKRSRIEISVISVSPPFDVTDTEKCETLRKCS